MTFALFLAALRCHLFSVTFTSLMLAVFASLLGVAIPFVFGAWVVAAIVTLEVWHGLEPVVLRRLSGHRAASYAESELLKTTLVSTDLVPVISSDAGFLLMRGMRCLIVGRDELDLLEQRALAGVLHQAALPVHRADLAGAVIVWLGELPLLAGSLACRGCCVLGRLVGLVVGESLVLPLVLWRDGFLAWSERLFGAIILALLAATLLADGYAAAGFELAMAWLAVPALKAVLAWESRRVESAADRETIDAGYGSQLLEALELLTVAEPPTSPNALLRLIRRPGAPFIVRADRVRKTLSAD